MKKLLTLLIFFTLTGAACKKDSSNNTLPPITQEGKNTFGCYVDGQLWLPSEPYSITARVLCILLDRDNTFSLLVQHDHGGFADRDRFLIVFKPVMSTGTYDLSDKNKARLELSIEGESEYSDTYTVAQGKLIINRYDNIVAGQFNFTIKNNKTGKIYNVTDGRFDLESTLCH